jgi:outer membrane immunogenic protein
MFRTILLSSAAIAALSTVSFAADLPARKMAPAPIMAAPIFTWTGFYVGAQLGGAWTGDKVSDYATGGAFLGSGKLDHSAIVGGVHAGYNMQAGAIVYGLEGDIEGTGLSKTSNSLFNPAGVLFAGVYGYNTKIDWQGSIRGRLGYAAGPALFYVTGGVAFANVKTGYTSAAGAALAAGSYSFSDTRAGWTVGGGVEYAFNNNWSARVEYRYTDFGSFTDVTAAAPVTFWSGESIKHKLTEQAVRVGISYKFGAPAGAVVARY